MYIYIYIYILVYILEQTSCPNMIASCMHACSQPPRNHDKPVGCRYMGRGQHGDRSAIGLAVGLAWLARLGLVALARLGWLEGAPL